MKIKHMKVAIWSALTPVQYVMMRTLSGTETLNKNSSLLIALHRAALDAINWHLSLQHQCV